MKYLKVLLATIFKIYYFFLICYVLINIPSTFGYKPLIIKSGSMEPTLRMGGILYYKKIKYDDLKVGDIVVYKFQEKYISHRITKKNSDFLITKGDSNDMIDSREVRSGQVIGKTFDFSIPYIGYYANYIYKNKIIIYIFIILCAVKIFLEKSKAPLLRC